MIVPDPDKIHVPRDQGEVLVNPALHVLAAAARKGRELSGAEGKLQAIFGRSFADLLQRQRQHVAEDIRRHALEIGDTAPEFRVEVPWIVTGHQVEFYHAGVWAKVIAAHELAKKTGGMAMDLLVDHDLVEEMGFDMPDREADGSWKRRAVLFDAPSPLPVEALLAPDASVFGRWIGELRQLRHAQSDALSAFLEGLAPPAGAAREPYTRWMSGARRRFEKSLGLQVAHLPTTRACAGPAWAAFVQAWIAHAPAWTAVYNRRLAEYRRRQAIKNPEHPMPDLARNTGAGTYELPFWIYRHGEARGRLLARDGANPAILHGDDALPLTPELVSGNTGLLIRPRALTLTMFVRLFLADVFIHGIGGALYDQITDGIMLELFGPNAAASYGCVSAAWLLPLANHMDNSASVPWLKGEMHHLKHNPQLVMSATHQQYPPAAQALARRRELLERIGDSLEIDRRLGREARRKWFHELHAVNRQLHEIAPEFLADIARRLAAAEAAVQDNKVLLWREWFFALHSMSSLRDLVGKIAG